MGFKIIKPGLLTTIQDKGRFGYQKEGVIVSGAMDTFALRIANLLVGNQEEEAVIEITMLGPQIVFEQDHLVAITGANLSPTINTKPIGMNRPVLVKKGSVLSFGAPLKGCRAYMAVAGGFDIPSIMGSKSTYLRAALGGFDGRALQTGDEILCKEPSLKAGRLIKSAESYTDDWQSVPAKWFLHPELVEIYSGNFIHVIKGPEYELFSKSSKTEFWRESFQVTAQSDRMGYRLEGPTLGLTESMEMISSAVNFGTIQVPAEGNPIILMADHQTTGGYPRIGQVASADLPKLAQLSPGQSIKFKEVSLNEAQLLFFAQERKIEEIKRALQLKLSLTA